MVINPYFVTSTIALGPIGSKITDFWDLSEASGTRFDSIIANASDAVLGAGPVGTMTGPKGGGDVAAAFTAAGEYLHVTVGTTIGQNIDIPSPDGGDHCYFGWLYSNTMSGLQFFLYRCEASGISFAQLTTALSVQSGTMYAQEGGSAYHNTSMSPPSSAAWHFFALWRDASDGLVRLQIDNGSVAVGGVVADPIPQTGNLMFGQAPGFVFGLDGGLSRIGWIKGNILTSGERTTLYNGGPSGALSWADIVAGGL